MIGLLIKRLNKAMGIKDAYTCYTCGKQITFWETQQSLLWHNDGIVRACFCNDCYKEHIEKKKAERLEVKQSRRYLLETEEYCLSYPIIENIVTIFYMTHQVNINVPAKFFYDILVNIMDCQARISITDIYERTRVSTVNDVEHLIVPCCEKYAEQHKYNADQLALMLDMLVYIMDVHRKCYYGKGSEDIIAYINFQRDIILWRSNNSIEIG